MLIFPVFIPMQGCPHHCIYCSQTSFEAVCEPDFVTLKNQVTAFGDNHKGDIKQFAFYGGTFTGLDPMVQNQYYELVEPYLDENTSIRISTRPDYISDQILEWCLQHNVTTIELGIQDFDDRVLQASQRGYDYATARKACSMVRQAGFELGIQLLPGLLLSDDESIRFNQQCLKEIMPDFLRLYPLIILSETPLMEVYKAGKITPLSLEKALDICADYCEMAEEYGICVIKCGIPSLVKDTVFVGPYHPAFGELVKAEVLIRKLEMIYQAGQTVHLAAKDISLLTGHNQYSLNKLKSKIDSDSFKFQVDSELPSGKFRLSYI